MRKKWTESERIQYCIQSGFILVAWLKCRSLVCLIAMTSNWCSPCDLYVYMLHSAPGAAAARPLAVPGRSWKEARSPQSVLAISCPLTYLVLFRCNCKVRCLQFNSIYLWFSLCQVEGRPHYLSNCHLFHSPPSIHTACYLLPHAAFD